MRASLCYIHTCNDSRPRDDNKRYKTRTSEEGRGADFIVLTIR